VRGLVNGSGTQTFSLSESLSGALLDLSTTGLGRRRGPPHRRRGHRHLRCRRQPCAAAGPAEHAGQHHPQVPGRRRRVAGQRVAGSERRPRRRPPCRVGPAVSATSRSRRPRSPPTINVNAHVAATRVDAGGDVSILAWSATNASASGDNRAGGLLQVGDVRAKTVHDATTTAYIGSAAVDGSASGTTFVVGGKPAAARHLGRGAGRHRHRQGRRRHRRGAGRHRRLCRLRHAGHHRQWRHRHRRQGLQGLHRCHRQLAHQFRGLRGRGGSGRRRRRPGRIGLGRQRAHRQRCHAGAQPGRHRRRRADRCRYGRHRCSGLRPVRPLACRCRGLQPDPAGLRPGLCRRRSADRLEGGLTHQGTVPPACRRSSRAATASTCRPGMAL
jgi:hypothetical protein